MKIGVIQLTSKLDYKKNLKKIEEYLKKAIMEKAMAVFLPECFYSMSDGKSPTPFLICGKDEHYQNIRELAIRYGLYLLGGSVAVKEGDAILNRVLNFDPQGNDLGTYDKRNLFSCHLEKDGKVKKISESDIYTPGIKGRLIVFEGVKVGLGVCFDLRYPLISWEYRCQGAQILTYSSAFTLPTGKAHWHTLLKARAIENQCFVIASAQWGKNNDKMSTYGHSLVVDPWGEVLVDAKEGEKIVFAEINLRRIDEVRKSILIKD